MLVGEGNGNTMDRDAVVWTIPGPTALLSMSPTFTYRSARSGSLTFGVILVLAVETMVFDLWLSSYFPIATWLLTATSIATFWWIVADYRAMGVGEIRVHDDAIELPIGKRFRTRIRRTDILSADLATWRELVELPAGGVNLTKPAEPNVLLHLRAPTAVQLFAGMSKRVNRVGLHVDEPAAFVRALGATSS